MKLTVTVKNGRPCVEYGEIRIDSILPKMYYKGKTYNVLTEFPHGEWKVEQRGETAFCRCDNFTLTFTTDGENLLIKGSYINDTGARISHLSYYDVLGGCWQTGADECFYNRPYYINGVFMNEMQMPVEKIRLVAGKQQYSADFVCFTDDDARAVTFGFVTFNEQFSMVSVGRAGDLTALATMENHFIEAGESVVSDVLYVSAGKRGAAEGMNDYAAAVAKHMHVTPKKQPPCGYCTWYYYGGNISEKIVLDALEEIKKHPEIPYKLLQIDDGWFVRRGEYVENERFSSMKELAKKINAAGLTAGIWVNPHTVDDNTDIYKNHKDWFVKNWDNDEPYEPRCLDFSVPEARQWLYDLFKKLSKDWGYKYIKVDIIAGATCGGRYYDPSFNSLKNYRESFRIMREAAGDDVFLLACTSPLPQSAGVADGVRTSVDIFERFDSLKDVFNGVLNRFYMNGKLLVCDPDCLLMRKAENEDGEAFRNCVRTDAEIRTFMTAIAASGGTFMHSDKLSLLTDEQYKQMSVLFPQNTRAALPVDIMKEYVPSVLDFQRIGKWEGIAFINWSERTRKFPLTKRGRVFEFWSQSYLGVSDGTWQVEVPPHEAKMLFVCDEAGACPIGVDDVLVPDLHWEKRGDRLCIQPIKDSEGVYVYAESDLTNNAGVKKTGENVYFVRADGEKEICLKL